MNTHFNPTSIKPSEPKELTKNARKRLQRHAAREHYFQTVDAELNQVGGEKHVQRRLERQFLLGHDIGPDGRPITVNVHGAIKAFTAQKPTAHLGLALLDLSERMVGAMRVR